ncbi:MAG TPA: TetR family transcriptional regulator [Micromonosporaceae bacterium]|nr:TetR family transcriptional regulator [Micromonosporaceae bacterium]
MALEQGLRQRKKERTRVALVEAAITLFQEKGYESTTIAEIAGAAEVAPRTFFSYFPTKEDVLFADTEDRIALALEIIDGRAPGDGLVDVLLRTVREIADTRAGGPGPFGRLPALRARLTLHEPAVQGYALRRLFEAQRQLADRLRAAYPEKLDDVTAAAVVGSFVGALIGVVLVAMRDEGVTNDPERVSRAIRRAADVAVRGIAAFDAAG